MNKKTEIRFYDLLGLKLSGDATSEDLAVLHQILEDNPELRFIHDELMKPASEVISKEQTEQAYALHFVKKLHLENKTDAGSSPIVLSPRTRSWKYVLLAAASVIGVIVFISLFNKHEKFPVNTTSKNEMVTQKGSRSRIVLPDSTIVVLNADSKISYDEMFTDKNRVVTLSGEAYFDVKHDAAHPFIIHTTKADVKVLGTAFNVRSYPQENIFETALIRGRVEVSLKDQPEKKIILTPSQKIVIHSDTVSTHKLITKGIKDEVLLTSVTTINNVIAETSWVNDQMAFVNTPLYEIAKELERKFNVRVNFKTPAAMNYRYTGVFDHPRLDEVLNIIQLSKKIDYQIYKDEVVIE